MSNRSSTLSLVCIALLPLLALGSFLRLCRLMEPSLWLDEILSYDLASAAVAQVWHKWIFGFEAENGPLYYLLQLVGRAFDSPERSTRIVSAVVGILTIPLVACSGRRLTGSWSNGLLAALLLTVSPMHVYYSREGRPYSLLILWMTLMLATIGSTDRARRVVFAIACVAAAYTAATSFPLLLSALVACAGGWLVNKDSTRRKFALCAGGAFGSLVWAAVLYGRFSQPRPVLGFPPFTLSLMDELVQAYTVAVMDKRYFSQFAYVILGLAVFGGISLWRRHRTAGWILISMAVLPVVTGFASLATLNHWFAVRYLAAGLPSFLILAAEGLLVVAAAASTRGPRAVREALRIAVVSAVVLSYAFVARTAALKEPFQKTNWRLIASTLWHHSKKGDVVIASNDWTQISLSFYLRRLPPRIHVANAAESPEGALHVARGSNAAWLLASGFHGNDRIVGWMCRSFPVVASRWEPLQLFFYPDFQSWIDSRATSHERRRYAEMFVGDRHGRLEMDENDAMFLRGGWGGAEHNDSGGAFRWIEGTRAEMALPAWREGDLLRFRALPVGVPGKQQELIIELNGVPLPPVAMTAGWNDYEIPLPFAQKGLVQARLVFAHSASPAEISGSSDRRRLSAAFDFLEIVPEGSDERRLIPPAGRFTQLKPRLLDETGRTVLILDPPLQSVDFPSIEPSRWRVPEASMLAGRLGMSPQVAGAALRQGDVSLEDLLEPFIEQARCFGNEEFLRRTFQLLLYREPDQEARRVYGSRLQKGRSRRGVAISIIKSDEFASKHFRGSISAR